MNSIDKEPSLDAMKFAVKWGQSICPNDHFGLEILARAFDEEFNKMKKCLQWIVDNQNAHPENIKAVAREGLGIK
jgi:hypothetical protein